jgi:hypothetical protein
MNLVDKVNRLREMAVQSEPCEPTVLVEQLRKPEGGFVDLVFNDELALVEIVDARGNRMEIGHWLPSDDGHRLRLPWPTFLDDPTVNTPGRTRKKRGTENKAAAMQMPRSGTARAAVLSAFIADRREGGNGLIDEDVAKRLDMNLYTAAPRRTELVNMGWLRPSGKFGRTKMHSESIKWELTPAAIERLGLR